MLNRWARIVLATSIVAVIPLLYTRRADGWFHPILTWNPPKSNVNIEVTFTRLRIRHVNTTLGSYVMTF